MANYATACENRQKLSQQQHLFIIMQKFHVDVVIKSST